MLKMDPAKQARLKAVRDRVIEAAKAELKNGDVTALELLAVLAHATGACIAMQDQRKITRELALEVVSKNLEAGNLEAISELMSVGGRPV